MGGQASLKLKRDFVDIAMEFSMASITSDHEILIMGVDGGEGCASNCVV